MKPSPSTLATLVAKLRLPIWDKPTPPPRPTTTWQSLKVGDRLTSRVGPPGAMWEVEATTSGGATLRMVVPFRAATTLLITDPTDLGVYTKVRKPRAPRALKKETT